MGDKVRKVGFHTLNKCSLTQTYRRNVSPAGELLQFLQFAKQLAGNSCNNAVLVDQVSSYFHSGNSSVPQVLYHHEDREALLERLRDHLFNNVVTVLPGLRACAHAGQVFSNGHYFKQVEGISQGSVLSTLLCGYGDMCCSSPKVTRI